MNLGPPEDGTAGRWQDRLRAGINKAMDAIRRRLGSSATEAQIDQTITSQEWTSAVEKHAEHEVCEALLAAVKYVREGLGIDTILRDDEWFDQVESELLDELYDIDDEIRTAARRSVSGATNTVDTEVLEDLTDQLSDRVSGDILTSAIAETYEEAAEETESVLVWFNKQDNRVRSSHEIHGQIRGEDGFFILAEPSEHRCTKPRDPELPGADRYGCRCRMTMVDADDPRVQASHRSDMTAAPAVTLNPAPPTGAPIHMTTAFAGIVALEGRLTSDDRLIDMGALTTREMPGLPFFFMNEQTQWGHLGSRLAGHFREFNRVPQGDHNLIDGMGLFDMGGEVGLEAHRQYSEGHIRGASVDLDVAEYELRLEDGTVLKTPDERFDAWMRGLRIIIAFTKARIMGTTGTATPAFDETRIEVLKPTRALVASWNRAPEGLQQVRLHLPTPTGWGGHAAESTQALVASAPRLADPNEAFQVPRIQDAAWYAATDAPAKGFPITYYDSGQVDGYFWLRGQRHPANGEMPEASRLNYDDTYKSGVTASTTEGEIRCCPIYFDLSANPKFQWVGDHPDVNLDWDQTREAYRVDGRVGAHGRIYEDAVGYRFRGGALFGITNGDHARLKAGSTSGDWRDGSPTGGFGHRELLAVASTPRPAFRTGEESLEEMQARYTANGMALVASADGGVQTVEQRIAAFEKDLVETRALIGEKAFAETSDILHRVLGTGAPKYFQVPAKYRS